MWIAGVSTSPSITPTRRPSPARTAARLAAMHDFPAPRRKETTEMIFVIRRTCRSRPVRGRRRAVRDPAPPDRPTPTRLPEPAVGLDGRPVLGFRASSSVPHRLRVRAQILEVVRLDDLVHL